MAKSRRSHKQSALRTVRREKLGKEQHGWVAEAEKNREEAIQRCMAAAPLPVYNTVEKEEAEAEAARGRAGAPSKAVAKADAKADKMEEDKEQPAAGGKRKVGGKRGVVKRKGKVGKKAGVLWGRNQMHKKKKKGE